MVSRSNVEGVKRLLDAGADVNKAENDGWSPLIMSAELGNLELVQVVHFLKVEDNFFLM